MRFVVFDRGKDAIAWKDGKTYLIECKRYDADSTTGRRELQIFVAAMKEENAQGGFYVSTGKFARTAQDYATQNQIELYARSDIATLVNRAFPEAADISTASVMCLECRKLANLPVADAPTSGNCPNGHPITNDITKGMICGDYAKDTVCPRCLVEMRTKYIAGTQYLICPKCRYVRDPQNPSVRKRAHLRR